MSAADVELHVAVAVLLARFGSLVAEVTVVVLTRLPVASNFTGISTVHLAKLSDAQSGSGVSNLQVTNFIGPLSHGIS